MSEFKVNLVYRVNSRIARATQKDHLKNKNKQQNIQSERKRDRDREREKRNQDSLMRKHLRCLSF